MKRLSNIVFFLMIGCYQLLCSNLLNSNPLISREKNHKVDSILNSVIQSAPTNGICAEEYYADLYIKSLVNIPQKNVLINLAPFMFKQQSDLSEYMMESFSELHYTAPNIFDQKIKAYYGTVIDMKNFNEELIDYFQINIYATTLLNSKLVSPLSTMAKKYYTYTIDSVYRDQNNRFTYSISFTPKNKSFQLVEGYMLVSDQLWSVRELYFKGKSEYMTFDNLIQMGEANTEKEYLPVRYDLNASFSMLGNVMHGYFIADFNYKSIKQKKEEKIVNTHKNKYDLTESFTLKSDTSNYHTFDNQSFDKYRPVPLTDYEKEYYSEFSQTKEDTLLQINKTWDRVFWGNVEDIFIKNHTLHIPHAGSIRFSEILNPFLLSYSDLNGLSYRHRIRYRHTFKGDRLLRINPTIGYNFKFKEFYWQVPADWDYWPKKRASLHFNIGNGNRIYGSGILQDLKEIPDSIFDFNKIELKYFRNFYIDLTHRREIINGLSADIGFIYRKRSAIDKTTSTIPEVLLNEIDTIPQINYDNVYKSFALKFKLTWTPKQYYYKSGDRKVNLYSKWPTFSFDYERGIKGIFDGDGKYERIEFDMQHHIPLGLMRNLYYRAGIGAFTDQEDMYFVDFSNFSKSNLPTGWNDDIGGVLQLLDRRYYNASRKYIRANLTYEAPFLVSPLLLKRTPNVLNERIYVGILNMPHLNPYIEFGYGIGTHIFDFGVFVSNINGKFNNTGIKLTLELFNR